MWVGVLSLKIYRLWNAYRTLPNNDLCGRPLAVIAIIAVAIVVCAGLTVDLRFFDFPTPAIFLLVGITVGWADRHKSRQTSEGDTVDHPSPAASTGTPVLSIATQQPEKW
jgi:hypothetical protein